MNPTAKKRQVDFQVIAQWVRQGDRVLDLGCGRGVLLEFLMQKKAVNGLGIDISFDKVLSCVKRGVPVYQGDAQAILGTFADNTFDRVIFSRTVEHLADPDGILTEALRVGKRVTVGFVNHGFWVNRLNYLLRGNRSVNEVYPRMWYETVPANPFSVDEFERYCSVKQIRIVDRVHLAGDWSSPCRRLPNLRAGYAIYDLAK